MNFAIENIKKDLKELPEKDFLIKYLLKSNNWYFSEYQNKSEAEAIGQMDILKEIMNKHIGIAFHNVLMVGSGKIGCSLSPNKDFKKFDEGNNDSDIDIAIVSSKLFEYLWSQIRVEQRITYIAQYNSIASSIFRGFINEKDFKFIDKIRADWNTKIDVINKDIQRHLSIYHTINYRIYRSWEDLEDYHICGIQKLKLKL